MAIPGQMKRQVLAKATRLSKDNTTGKKMVSTLMIK